MIGARIYSNAVRAQDIACIIDARLGFSHDLIAKRTGLSKSTVAYRLKIWGVHVGDYRNGRTALSQRVLAAAEADSKRMLGEIKHHLKDMHQLQIENKTP